MWKADSCLGVIATPGADEPSTVRSRSKSGGCRNGSSPMYFPRRTPQDVPPKSTISVSAVPAVRPGAVW